MSPSRIRAKDRNVLFNPGTLLLHNTFTDPNKVPNLLKLQMSIAIIRSYSSHTSLTVTQMKLVIESSFK